ncbi:MAG TPA: UDP-N-acetylmuramoylalanyl-D-glutamyl-2,6-diaminopimelate--D-alanyl-D-alanine ligase [Aestuariivirgaceae bacterium]|nr:UDP-N-acetylmuramoylalanyl-D-glutamyl-2,6-diaminopimelate--D-alanyl-D-alanine ligase [Aestuariivirgaceae bacterium]
MTAPLWTIEELIAATGGRLDGDIARPMNGVSIDSRSIAAGDVFVAIRGEHRDGHEFAAAALKAGAAVAIVSRPDPGMRDAGALLVVDEPLAGLQRLAAAARARSNAAIVGVTGSVGKTTTKEALRLALSASGPTHASAASYNNQWGVPLSLARLPRSAAFGVFEIGMSQAGEIAPLTRLVRPHVAIVTTIAASHLGNFPSLAAIADAKAEIFQGVEPGGAAVIQRDSEFFDRLAMAARQSGVGRIVGFGEHGSAEVRLDRAVLHEDCSCVTASMFGEVLSYRIGSPGRHVVMNSLAVLAAAELAGADLARAAMALAHLEPQQGRGVRFKLDAPDGAITVIDESYNANPASMRAALALLGQATPGRGGRRIAVLGDMLELGEDSPRLHAELAQAIDENGANIVYACGAGMAHLWKVLPAPRRGAYGQTSQDLQDTVLRDVRGGDVVMIKGSLGSRMMPLVEAIKKRYSGRAA